MPIADTVEPWCYEATRDNIRHYAHGIGDDNPLWCDPDVRRADDVRHGHRAAELRLRAQPDPVRLRRRPARDPRHVGGRRPQLAPTDHPRHRSCAPTAHLKDLVEHDTRFAGRAFQQIYHVEFFDESTDELLCSGDSWCFRTERDAARELGTKYERAEGDGAEAVDRRGAAARSTTCTRTKRSVAADPRYVEDVEVGDELPVMVKGPMTVTGFIAFAQGWGGLYIRANKLAHKLIKKHPGLGIPNACGIPDVPERVHWEDDLAARRRHAGRLRLRARALLLADAPPHELDG